MSFRIAAASSDGNNIDQHFGQADSFYIYEVNADGTYKLLSVNSPGRKDDLTAKKNEGFKPGGCGGCHGGGAIEFDTGFLDGAKYVLAAKIGKGIEKTLIKNNITPFSVETSISEAVKKIVIYENRLNKFK